MKWGRTLVSDISFLILYISFLTQEVFLYYENQIFLLWSHLSHKFVNPGHALKQNTNLPSLIYPVLTWNREFLCNVYLYSKERGETAKEIDIEVTGQSLSGTSLSYVLISIQCVLISSKNQRKSYRQLLPAQCRGKILSHNIAEGVKGVGGLMMPALPPLLTLAARNWAPK